jgi:putative nucleotidyltransferase with HDIG domain
MTYSLAYTGMYLLHSGVLNQLNWTSYLWFGGNALLLLLASPLIFGYEKLFGLISEVTLLELSDSNAELLKELSFRAPGTFQHSLQVANLAESAISYIGGNALLVRVGALYHDIGKMRHPRFFIENQAGGANPHDELPYDESASIIVGHVKEGIRIARDNKLPEVIIDFIRTHHGDQRVEFFYRSFLRNFPERKVEEEKFTYPGPRPFSKETAVLMMADSVEAASRSLKEYTEENIRNLVEGIIDRQMIHHQFDNANITLKDIANVKRIFIKMLNSIYHVRIEYPKEVI